METEPHLFECRAKNCQVQFQKQNDYEYHTINHNSEYCKSYERLKNECPICDSWYLSRNKKNKHMEQHGKMKDKKHMKQCQRCPRSFYSQESLDNHLERCERRPFKCVVCRKLNFATEMDLFKHTSKCKPRDERAMVKYIKDFREHVCDVCFDIFDKDHYLAFHKEVAHGEDSDHVCEICYATFKNVNFFNNHLRADRHFTVRCRHCNKLHYDVKEHKRCEWNNTVMKFPCDFCGLPVDSRNFRFHLESLHCDRVWVHFRESQKSG